jgi:hypothetical protein
MKTSETPSSGVLLSRCVIGDEGIMPVEVAAWMVEHAKLPEEHKTRVRELYDRQMDEVISESERAELDRYSELIAAIDIIRAKAKFIVRKAA